MWMRTSMWSAFLNREVSRGQRPRELTPYVSLRHLFGADIGSISFVIILELR